MVELIVLFAISTLLGLGSLGFAVWVVLSPETFDLDKIFSIMVSVLMGSVFLGLSAWVLFRTSLRRVVTKAPAAPGGAAIPAAEANPQAKQTSQVGPPS